MFMLRQPGSPSLPIKVWRKCCWTGVFLPKCHWQTVCPPWFNPKQGLLIAIYLLKQIWEGENSNLVQRPWWFMAFIQDLESQKFQAGRILEITLSYPLMSQIMGLRNREIRQLQPQEATEGHGQDKGSFLIPSQSSFYHISLQQVKEMYTDLELKPSVSSAKPGVELFTAGTHSDRCQ